MSKRPVPGDPGDSERLPWLEPYSEPAAKPAAVRPKRPPAPKAGPNGALWGIGALALLAAAAGGGYWLGQREGARPAAPTAQTSPVIPVTPAPAPEPLPAPELEAAAEPEPAPEPAVQSEKPRPAERATPAPRRKAEVRRADARRPQFDRVVVKQREAVRTWPKMPSPGPAGQVVQLGAFSNRARAEAAYRERVARYPLLSGMPQVIVPIITRPRGQVLYVLRLGTRTREQSQIVCRNLQRSGDHCLVIG